MIHSLLVASLSGLAAAQDRPMGWTGVLDEEAFAALHELRADQAPPRTGRAIEIDGARAYLALPSAGEPLGGIVVIHEWWGLNEHIEHWTDRLAADGYAALAVDIYHGKVATTPEEAQEAMKAVDEAAALATLRAAHAHLAGELDLERTAAIGWCFGGGWSLRLALAEPELDAAVIYYGRLVTEVDALRAIEADVLGIFGARDDGIPPEAVAEFEQALAKAEVEHEILSYDAEHAFANPSSARYDREHAGAAWEVTRAFLCRKLSPPAESGAFSAGTRRLEVPEIDGWERGEERPMRLATFKFGSASECYVAALPGQAGGLAANLNRWREQLGEKPLSDDEIASLPRIPLLGKLAPAIRVEGTFRPMSGEPITDAALLGAMVLLADEAVFVKLVGPRAEVDAQGARFTAFCRGLH